MIVEGGATVQVLLLRGVNVGGHHKLPMALLREVLVELGGRQVRTYIQSGNAVLRAPGEGLEGRVQAALEVRLGFAVPVIRRTAAELEAVAGPHPLADPGGGLEGTLDKHLYVGFLDAWPDPARVAALHPDRSPPDRFQVSGREVYLAFPGGSARSRLTNDWLDRALGVRSTWRNLLTVRALLGLARELEAAGDQVPNQVPVVSL